MERGPITTDTVLRTLFTERPGVLGVFLDRRMLCPGCPITPFHTVGDACEEYGLDPAPFIAALMAAPEAD